MTTTQLALVREADAAKSSKEVDVAAYAKNMTSFLVRAASWETCPITFAIILNVPGSSGFQSYEFSQFFSLPPELSVFRLISIPSEFNYIQNLNSPHQAA